MQATPTPPPSMGSLIPLVVWIVDKQAVAVEGFPERRAAGSRERKTVGLQEEAQRRLPRGCCALEVLGPQDPPLLLPVRGGRHHPQSMEKTISLKTTKHFLDSASPHLFFK